MLISLFWQVYLGYRDVSIRGKWVKCIQKFFVFHNFSGSLNLEWFLDFSKKMIVEFKGENKRTVFKGKLRFFNSIFLEKKKRQIWVENALQSLIFPPKMNRLHWEMKKNIIASQLYNWPIHSFLLTSCTSLNAKYHNLAHVL